MPRLNRRLSIVDGRSADEVTLPRYRVVEAAMDAIALADDLSQALAAIEQRMWSNNRAGAINEIGRAGLRIEQLRDAFAGLAGLADTAPTDPGAAARVAA